ncbi:transposase [Mucilaginibacter sp. RCC_168]|uniref:transposase n=1 Tax=Mucilaginibacter sp. RCC_168 TaxID=3239221 RepID=UPI003526BF0A
MAANTSKNKTKAVCNWNEVEILEITIPADHVHPACSIPSNLSIGGSMGIIKGKTALTMFKNYPGLRKKQYWGNNFGAEIMV